MAAENTAAREGAEPIWWFKDIVLVLILSLMVFGLQAYVDNDRTRRAEGLENVRQELSRDSDDRRQHEDHQLENLRFVRERAESNDASMNRPFASLDLEGQYLAQPWFGERQVQ